MEFANTLFTSKLFTRRLPEDHTGVQLQDALSVTSEQWDLNEYKLTAITTDSETSKSVVEIEAASCFGHNLDLAINKGLNDRIEWVSSVCR